MDLSQFVADFVKANGVSTVVLAFLAWFLTTRFWPWYTTKYWPAVQEQKKDMIAMMGTTANAMIEVKVALVQMSQEMESMRRDLGHMRDIGVATGQDVVELREWSKEALKQVLHGQNGRERETNGRYKKNGTAGGDIAKRKPTRKKPLKSPAYRSAAA